MGKEKDIFNPCFKKTRYYELTNVNFDSTLHVGSGQLVSHHNTYYLIWTIRDFPVELPSMPGAPYPVHVRYTIFEKCNKPNKTYDSLSGEFVYEINSGTLPQFNAMGIPYGVYKSIGRNNKYNRSVNVVFSVTEEPLEIIISK
jgi:hypothetical protein